MRVLAREQENGKNTFIPKVIDELQADQSLPKTLVLLQIYYFHNPPETCGERPSVHQTVEFSFFTTVPVLGDPLCLKWFRFPINKEYHTFSQITCADQIIYKQYWGLQLVIR
jgi:hypothetical protein